MSYGWLANTILGPPPDPQVDAYNHVLDLLIEYAQTVKEWGGIPVPGGGDNGNPEAWREARDLLEIYTTYMEANRPKTFEPIAMHNLAEGIEHIVHAYRESIPKLIMSDLRQYPDAFRQAVAGVSGPKPEGSQTNG